MESGLTRLLAMEEKFVPKKSEIEKELANAIEDYELSVSSEWRVLVNTVSSIMERHGMDAVSEIKIPPGVVAKSERFAERGLKIFTDWGEISRQARAMLIMRNEERARAKQERSRKR